jgi:hypothetical protein
MAKNALLDFLQGASNSVAGNVSAPVDGLAWLLRKAGINVGDAPFGGSDWMRSKGLTADPENKLAGILGESFGGVAPMLAAVKAPQIANSLLKMGENAAIPSTLNKQAGVLSIDLKNELEAKYRQMLSDDPYGVYGVRVFSPNQKSDIGTKLTRSSNWVDGVPKSTKLPGTAVFELRPRDAEKAIGAALRYNLGEQGMKVGLVRGDELAPHRMPEAFSALIKSPVVQHIYDWPTDL